MSSRSVKQGRHNEITLAQVYVCRYGSEERMLLAWLAKVEQTDPDAFYLYQV